MKDGFTEQEGELERKKELVRERESDQEGVRDIKRMITTRQTI